MKDTFSLVEKKTKTVSIANSWRKDFDIYKRDLNNALDSLFANSEWIANMQEAFPHADIKATILKSVREYWGQEVGWKKKKASKGSIDWRMTFFNALKMSWNIVPKKQTTLQGRGFAV